MSQNMAFSFHIDKILCFVTRDGQVIEKETDQRFLEAASLYGLLGLVSSWMVAIKAEVGAVDGDTYHFDNNDLTLYCHFESEAGSLSENEKNLIRRALKIQR